MATTEQKKSLFDLVSAEAAKHTVQHSITVDGVQIFSEVLSFKEFTKGSVGLAGSGIRFGLFGVNFNGGSPITVSGTAETAKPDAIDRMRKAARAAYGAAWNGKVTDKR